MQYEGIEVNWQNVLYPHGSYRDINDFNQYSKLLKYPLLCWNGRIYSSYSLKDTGYKASDIK